MKAAEVSCGGLGTTRFQLVRKPRSFRDRSLFIAGGGGSEYLGGDHMVF